MEILSGIRWNVRKTLTLILALLAVVIPSNLASQDRDEYAVKAAFIFNFTKFVQWPQNNVSDPFGICVLGDDPFEASIDQLTQGKSAYGRAIQIRRVKEVAESRTCQIVFVSSLERTKAVRLIEALHGMPVLTIGESMEFLRMGGLIALSVEGSHVNIIINANAAQNVNLKISAHLLTLAKIYKTEQDFE